MKTTGNTILITGGGSGIGEALAHRFHDLGNTVIIAGRRQDALERSCAGRPGMHAMTVDVDSEAGIADFARRLLSAHPALNVLINNAGIMRFERLDSARDLSDAEETINTNLLGPIRMIDALIDHLIATPDAAIVNVTSGLAFVPLTTTPTYNATKAAIHSWTQSLRHQLADTSVEVLELAPPAVATDIVPGHAENPNSMPLADYTAEVIGLIERGETPRGEILVERVKPLRFAEANGYEAVFEQLNGAH